MKQIIAIPLILLILFSGVSIKFATHYCGGYVAATKVSLSGELATCGMEATSESQTSELTLSKHCCEDTVASYAIDNNYTPSFSFSPKIYENDLPAFSLPIGLPYFSFKTVISSYTNISPPGDLMPTEVDISSICVFRI